MNKEQMREELKVMLINGSAMLGAYLLKRATEKLLESLDKKAPKNPEDRDITWTEALGWAAFIGATAGMTKLLIKRGAKTGLDKLF